MRSHKLIAHVADVRLSIKGDSLEELFYAALEGMASLSKENVLKEEPVLKEKVSISASDVTALLIDFLSEVLTKQHINKTIYYKVEFDKISETELKATIHGFNTDFFDEDIKAVTYHEANVVRDKEGNYVCVIVFDI